MPKLFDIKNVFVSDVQILMSDGTTKNMDEIQYGDKIITHKGNSKKVLQKNIIRNTKELIKIQVSTGRPIICTSNCLIYVIKNLSNDSNIKRSIQNKKVSYEYKKASEITKKDILLYPIINKIVKNDLSEEKARLLGLFAAEGSFKKYNNKYSNAIFTFSIKEKNTLALDTINLIKKLFNTNVKINIRNNACDIIISNKDVINFLFKNIGEYSKYKKLSEELVFSKEEIKKQFIIGWMEGDGGIDKYSGKLVGTTVSKSLASQVRLMLHSLKINNTLYKNIRKPTSINGKIISGGIEYRLKIPYNQAKQFTSTKLNFNINKNIISRNIISFNHEYRLYSIVEINKINFDGNIYDLNIEDDNSYIINDIIVSNYNNNCQ